MSFITKDVPNSILHLQKFSTLANTWHSSRFVFENIYFNKARTKLRETVETYSHMTTDYLFILYISLFGADS